MIEKIGKGKAENFIIVKTEMVSCVLTDGELLDKIALAAAAKNGQFK